MQRDVCNEPDVIVKGTFALTPENGLLFEFIVNVVKPINSLPCFGDNGWL
jgi:hypothetical protein